MSLLVVKCGGAVAASAAREVLALAAEHDVVVVHGAGPQISAAMQERGLDVRFVDGRRVTTIEALTVVRAAFAAVNAELCVALGPCALGLMGDEIGLPARRIEELGFVGEPEPWAPQSVLAALSAGLIPVVAPLAAGPLNVNADDMAAALAVGLAADRLVFLSDVPGLLRAHVLVDEIDATAAEELLAAGEFEGGIVPKLHAAVRAARRGVTASIGETAVVA